MLKVLFVVGVRPMLLLFVYTISLDCLLVSADAGDEKTSASNGSSPARFFHHGPLTKEQLKSIVTIELNCTNINTKNRTTVDSIYSNVHREILKRLTRTKATTAATTLSTSIATTESIPATPTAEVTTIATTVETTTNGGIQILPPSNKKRKKRQQTFDDGVVIKEGNLRFVEVDPETDDNGILALSLVLDVKGRNDIDCGLILLKAANTTTEDGTLDRVARVSVVTIYRGFPSNRRTITSENYAHPSHSIWPIVVIAIVVVLIVIVVVIIIWKKKQVRKLEISGGKRSSIS